MLVKVTHDEEDEAKMRCGLGAIRELLFTVEPHRRDNDVHMRLDLQRPIAWGGGRGGVSVNPIRSASLHLVVFFHVCYQRTRE